jgi:hypothetical protein
VRLQEPNAAKFAHAILSGLAGTTTGSVNSARLPLNNINNANGTRVQP